MAIRCKVERKRGERPAATETNQNLDLEVRAGQRAPEGSSIVNFDSVSPDNLQVSVAYLTNL